IFNSKINQMSELRIEFDEALELCGQIRAKNKQKSISYNKMWCWGCAKFSKSPEKRCFTNSEDGGNTGCTQVNRLYKKLKNL
ncbi:MAG: hypothetical protein ACW972_07570, partial [Promethearchaeota archaeon]